MRPAGLTPDIAQLMPPGRRPHILHNADPFMEHRPEQVERTQLLHNAVADRLVLHLLRERPEHPVPDDEDARIVAVQIARVGRVVDAVVARRVHHRLKPAREAVNRLGVDPELVDEVHCADERDHRRMKAKKQQRHPEDKADREKAGPSLP